MWNTDTLWFEVAIVSIVIALGHILLGHFEEKTPKLRKLVKYAITLLLVTGLSLLFNRTIAFGIFGAMFIPVLYIHLVLLPRKGINGWTGEPKSRYYDFRGWSK